MKAEIMLEFPNAAAVREPWREVVPTGDAGPVRAVGAAPGPHRARVPAAPASDFAAVMRRVEAECYDRP